MIVFCRLSTRILQLRGWSTTNEAVNQLAGARLTWTVISVAVVHLSIRAGTVSAVVRRRRRITAARSDACSSATRKSARPPLRPRAPVSVYYNNRQIPSQSRPQREMVGGVRDSGWGGNDWPSQVASRQGRVSVSAPRHCRPPWRGSGLSHVLCRCSIPSPHVTLHGRHGDQSPQPPATRPTPPAPADSVNGTKHRHVYYSLHSGLHTSLSNNLSIS